MSTPIQQKQRVRARKLLNDAANALADLRNERLNLGKETREAINEATTQVSNAQSELDAQPGA